MHELNFTLRQVRSVPPERVADELADQMVEFLESVRDQLRSTYQLSRVVAIDQASFWNTPTILRSYAPIGGRGEGGYVSSLSSLIPFHEGFHC
jgi:hypothetical protein